MEFNFNGFLTLFEKEVKRYCRVIVQTVLSPLVQSFIYLLVFGVSFTKFMPDQQGVPYLYFLIPGLVAMASFNNALQNSVSSIMVSKFHGDLQDLRSCPIGILEITLAYHLAALTRGLLVGFLVLLSGEVFSYMMFGKFLPIAHPILLVLQLSLGSLIFASIGIFVGFLAKTFDQMNAAIQFVITPLLYLGGVFFSVEGLSPFWTTLVHLNPLFYLTNGIRFAILDVADPSHHWAIPVGLIAVVIAGLISIRAIQKGSFQRF